MSEFSKMLKESFIDSINVQTDEIINPEIVEITNSNIIVDLNYKSEGVISIKEILELDGENVYKVGDKISLYVVDVDDGEGNPVLSYQRASVINSRSYLKNALKNNDFVDVLIERSTAKGLVAKYKSIECFIPYILCATEKRKDYSDLIGKVVSVKIIKFNEQNDSVIASRKYVLEQESGIDKVAILDSIKIGDIVDVTVKNIVNYGAFVTYKSLDALLYIKDISWFNIFNINDVLKSGDVLKVVVTGMNYEKEQISVSIKALSDLPWNNIVNTYKKGDEISMKVSGFNKHGLFLRHNSEIDFFIHKKMLKEYNGFLENAFDIGETIVANIQDLDLDKKILTLTQK